MLSTFLLCNLISNYVNSYNFGKKSSFQTDDDDLADEGFGFMNLAVTTEQQKARYGPFSGQFSPQSLFNGGAPSPEMLRSRIINTQQRQPSVDYGDKSSTESDTLDLVLMEERLNATHKWGEFYKLLREQRNKYKGKVLKDWEPDAHKWAMYSRNLLEVEKQQTRRPVVQNQHFLPSAGMGQYWGGEGNENEIGKNKPPLSPQFRNAPPQQQSAKPLKLNGFGQVNIMDMALKKMEMLEKQRTNGGVNQPAGLTTLTPESDTKANTSAAGLLPARVMPWVDDYSAPIKWVSFNSHATSDGLAKVTDPETGKNRQFIINGTIFVPVIDHNLERLGWSTPPPTTPLPPSVTTDNISLQVVMKIVDLKKVDEKDWLAFEVVLGWKSMEKTCDNDGCQARCHRLGCESVCSGDTCVSGCVGTSCSAYCRGPGCLAMCIGDFCTTKCDGINCDSRCRGKDCEATCSMFSCQRTVNGLFRQSHVTWDQMYPQYEETMPGHPTF